MEQAVNQDQQKNQAQELKGIQTGQSIGGEVRTRVVHQMTTYETVAPTGSWAVLSTLNASAPNL